MNKTLLLILCDFLLLTLLSLVDWEKDDESEREPAVEGGEQSVSAMAMMEQDLLDTLQASLDEETEAQERFQEDAEQSRQELLAANQELQEREASIDALQGDLSSAALREKRLADEKLALEAEKKRAGESIVQLETQYESLEEKALQTEAQARLLQAELDRKLEQLKEKEVALEREQQAKRAAEEKAQNLNVQVRVVEEQKRMLEENVETLKVQVVEEREERKQLQAQTSQMAEGITQLAERSQDLTEEFRSSQPINANELFAKFSLNRIVTTFASERYYRGQTLEEDESAVTILVSDGAETYALTHLNSTPLGLSKSSLGYRQVDATLLREEQSFVPLELEFLALDPRVAATRLTKEQAEALGGEVFFTALEPFKWSDAILVDEKGEYYGEVEFKLTANTPGYVRMQSKVFSRIFGDFSPTQGDLVFSKTGEFLGMMVDGRYCVLINNLLGDETLPLGRQFENNEFKSVIASLRNRYSSLPEELQ
ncbi:MAG: hypothetical protein CBD18_07970 [Opitutales bacterium TMED158]|nr:MAG: hypothetical protein CBD18_07970 [Opitutales bacterium TMED158]